MSQVSNQYNNTTIYPIAAFSDNYIWCIHSDIHAVVVDPGQAEPVLAYLKAHSLELVSILVTHHHFDHVGGIAELTQQYPNLIVYGPHNPNIEGITHKLAENDSISIAQLDLNLRVLETPGHTLDHIVYYNQELLFCGDTLFSAGCGRMFEGTPEVFYKSLCKLSALEPSTKVFCTHEYTQANVAFALSVEANNLALIEYAQWVDDQRANNKITLPSTILQEAAINPFLRCHMPHIQSSVLDRELNGEAANIATFAALRKLKDNF